MARVKNGAVTKARHKKVLKAAKGYFGSKHRLYKTAKERLMCEKEELNETVIDLKLELLDAKKDVAMNRAAYGYLPVAITF